MSVFSYIKRIDAQVSGKHFLLLLLILLNTDLIFSQTKEYINGKIINSSTKNPVAFATVKLKKNELGVYANAEGDFRIARNPDFRNDSLIITCIGYKRTAISYNDLAGSEVNIITLRQSIYGLNEVKIFAKRRIPGPWILIGRAIRRISINYPVKPFSYISYYRDYQKEGGNYINLNEAIVQTIDNGFSTLSTYNKYRLLDFRKNSDFPRIKVSPYYNPDHNNDYFNGSKFIPNATLGDQNGNELFILMVHDAIRNNSVRSFSFIDFFAVDFLKNHSFSDPIPVYDNNLLLYRVNFRGRKPITGKNITVSGAIYIQPDDYSIHKLEYSCFYNEGVEKKEMFNIDIEYGREAAVDSLMCLKYISFNNIFNLVDTADNSYFRILKSYWNPSPYSKSTLIVELNHKVDPASAARKINYEIRVGNKPRSIKNIQVSGNKLLIKLRDKNINKITHKCTVSIQNIKDTDGNILDHKRTIEMYQYRELFVQEYNKKTAFKDSCYMQYLPLEKNCISKVSGKDKYWMNTPENIQKINR
ncbi:MAG TPA: carboxypeptidase-like regulatory domain-containing protein [Bacteroidales bacterium]|nr:carboxypeptidase-like regulatory domain-containing protein [Bacteroidales bacterium]